MSPVVGGAVSCGEDDEDEANRRRRQSELTSGVFKQNLVVEPQAQLGHPGEEDAHLDGAHDLTPQDIAVGTHLWNTETDNPNQLTTMQKQKVRLKVI